MSCIYTIIGCKLMNLKFSPDYYSYELIPICINMAILISV